MNSFQEKLDKGETVVNRFDLREGACETYTVIDNLTRTAKIGFMSLKEAREYIKSKEEIM